VATTRLLTGEMVSSTTGREFTLGEGFKPTTRLDILFRFIKSKQSPFLSLVTSLLEGKNFAGEPIDPTAEVVDRFVPMFAGDIFEVMQEHGAERGWMALPGGFGVGVQTYGGDIPILTKTPAGRQKVGFKGKPTVGETIVQKMRGEEVSEIPEELRPALQEARKQELFRKTDVERAKKLVLETGETQYVGNTKVFLERGILKTKTLGKNLTPTKLFEYLTE